MNKKVLLFSLCLASCVASIYADNKESGVKDNDSTEKTTEEGVRKSRLSIGGYGEAVYSRNFYSDNVYRYEKPANYKNDDSNGRFDIPHAVIYLSYDFGKGWKMGSEIEFEHGGSGSTIEKEYEEGGEWEREIEKGGEVELEQFWLEKSFCNQLNVRAGHIIVPIGLTNAHHEPLEFFTVYRPEGEATIFPCTWHETGISLWGRTKSWRYEVQMTAGLDALMFSRDNWIQKGAHSPFEFKVANKYAFAARIDNYSVKGLRMGLSGYIGNSMNNTWPNDLNARYGDIKGRVLIGAFDFTYNDHNWLIRGNADYGTLSDADIISIVKKNRNSNESPYGRGEVGKKAHAIAIEAGYDIFSQISKLREDDQKLYIFGRYDNYNSYTAPAKQPEYNYTQRQVMTFGVNYHPVKQIVVKGEYSKRFFKSGFNNEPSVSLGIAYQGFFL